MARDNDGGFLRGDPQARAVARLVVQGRQPPPEILTYRRELGRMGDAMVEADNGYGFSAWLEAECPREGQTVAVAERGIQVKLIGGFLFRSMTPNEQKWPSYGTAAAWSRESDGWLKYPKRLFDEAGEPIGVSYDAQGRGSVTDLWRHLWVGEDISKEKAQ